MHPEFISLTQDAAFRGRVQPYRNIHKALRLAMFSTLDALGKADGGDSAGVLGAIAQVEQLLEMCDSHLRHENDFMHEALRSRDPLAVEAFDREHASQQQAALALHRQLGAVRNALPESVDAELYRLYLLLSAHVAGHLQHMAEEETELTTRFWANFSDAEIQQIEAALVASLSPAERASVSHWMFKALDHPERLKLAEGMRQAMPEADFNGLIEHLRTQIPLPAWNRLQRGMNSSAENERALA